MLAHPFHRGFGCDKSYLAGIHIAVRWFDVEPSKNTPFRRLSGVARMKIVNPNNIQSDTLKGGPVS
jgi:hypothetical protein